MQFDQSLLGDSVDRHSQVEFAFVGVRVSRIGVEAADSITLELRPSGSRSVAIGIEQPGGALLSNESAQAARVVTRPASICPTCSPRIRSQVAAMPFCRPESGMKPFGRPRILATGRILVSNPPREQPKSLGLSVLNFSECPDRLDLITDHGSIGRRPFNV